ncbi:LacI family transcriptional regulator [Cellulomonas bogoriensis 69B4 = DSM 16987]|uniref:LacI family transcriptional regulator n=1 Tax=Cellulomonas bogoriensis 69B4 = DSM 16987 TaxID=1386082 RepID=A0A0A0BY57_9CELL|nr:LacI family transcriptional regulator [Cellulomonas bogoriensis 69B4 = DSM 16987]
MVSYALNNRPGVSVATRDRVLRIADEFGWRPSAAARSIRSGPHTVGIAVSGEPSAVARSTGFLDFLTAVQDTVSPRGLSLSMQIIESAEAAAVRYREWWAERRFDLMIVPDLLTQDPRIEVLRRMHAPAVVVGPWGVAEGLACVSFDEEAAGARVATYLLELGHRHVAAVTAPAGLHRTGVRVEALRRTVEGHGGRLVHHATSASAEESAAATRALLQDPLGITAVVYDSDRMAVAGLDVARRSGVEVPWDLSIVAVGDSELCRLATPAITAMPMSAPDLGLVTGEAALAVLDGEADVNRLVAPGGVALRGSTGPPSAR